MKFHRQRACSSFFLLQFWLKRRSNTVLALCLTYFSSCDFAVLIGKLFQKCESLIHAGTSSGCSALSLEAASRYIARCSLPSPDISLRPNAMSLKSKQRVYTSSFTATLPASHMQTEIGCKVSQNMRLLPPCHILASCKSLSEQLVHISTIF